MSPEEKLIAKTLCMCCYNKMAAFHVFYDYSKTKYDLSCSSIQFFAFFLLFSKQLSNILVVFLLILYILVMTILEVHCLQIHVLNPPARHCLYITNVIASWSLK